MELVNRFAFPGILFILTLAFGFWLSRIGKPYNGLLFNVHKLIALSGVVLTIVQLTKLPLLFTPSSLAVIGLALATLSVLALFISGALMSAEKLDHALMRAIHRAGIGALVLCCVLVLWGLGNPP